MAQDFSIRARADMKTLQSMVSLMSATKLVYLNSEQITGYGSNHSILSALLDHIVQSYRVDTDRIHVTGFSMGMYCRGHALAVTHFSS